LRKNFISGVCIELVAPRVNRYPKVTFGLKKLVTRASESEFMQQRLPSATM